MDIIETVDFTGIKKTYTFKVYGFTFNQESKSISITLKTISEKIYPPTAGVYCFTRCGGQLEKDDDHEKIYVGQSGGLFERLKDHEKYDCIKDNGVNRVCILEEDNEQEREKIEDDLIQKYNPWCNEKGGTTLLTQKIAPL